MIVDTLLSLSLTSWIVFLTFVFAVYYVVIKKDSQKTPPTPGIALPIIGHAYLMEKNPVPLFREWREKLGDVFMLQMGARQIFVVNGYENLKHTLVKQADKVSDRPPTILRDIVTDSHLGILTSSGANWKEQRTVALAILREFGMGKNMLAEKIAEQAEDYLGDLKTRMGQPHDLRLLTNLHISNIICSIIFGQRFKTDDPDFVRLINIFNEQVQAAGQSNLVLFMPWLRHIPFDPFNFGRMFQNYKTTKAFTGKIIAKCLDNYDADTMTSFSASYVREMNKKKKAGVDTFLDDDNLNRVVSHLFIAGTETASSTILWFMLFMLYHPDIQEKIYQEIKQEVGVDRTPVMGDKPKLKFLQATIMETQRIANILPLNLNHYTSGPLEVQGYVIPEGSTVMPVLDSVLMDKKVWGDPENFRPERFLDQDGNLVKREELVPFSLGRRICLGEALAKMELFLFLSAMLQRFKFLPVDPTNLPPIKQLFGATCPPVPYNILWEER